MKKIILALAFLVAISGNSFSQETNNTYAEEKIEEKKAVGKASKSSVSIFSISSITGYTRCTGTLIKNDIGKTVVLSAKHCIDNMAEEVYVDGVLVDRYVTDNEKDLALYYLKSPILDKIPAVISDHDIYRKDLVFIYGYPTDEPYIKVGIVTVKSSKNYYAHLEVIGGCSGGAIFNLDGEVVGVLWGKLHRQNTSIFTSLRHIYPFLKENNLW